MKTILIICTLTFFSFSSGLIYAASMCGKNSDCDDGVFCNGVEQCRPSDSSANANGCTTSAPPCREDFTICSEVASRCERTACWGAGGDADGDGSISIACGGDDCDDRDRNRYPGNVEVCDARGHDEDCNITTFGNRDSDGDGYIDAACFNLAD